MTPEEHAAAAMIVFKQAAFDPIAMQHIEAVCARAIRAAVAEEREACAKLADERYEHEVNLSLDVDGRPACEAIAVAIRARGVQ